MNILKLSKIFEDFIDKHKSIHEIGRGMWMDKNPKKIYETLPTSEYTAYSENKDE